MSPSVVPVARLALPSRSVSVSQARRFVAAGLAGHGLDEEATETAVLLTSEVVTNAVVHCSTDVLLRLSVSDAPPGGPDDEQPGPGALVEVYDACGLVPLQREAEPDSVTGRGLALVELLASAFGTVPAEHGKVVWFSVGGTGDLPLPGQPGWSPQDAGTEDEPVHVLLRGVPVVLYDIMRQHNESLVREYQIHLLCAASQGAGETASATAAREDLARVARVRATVAAAVRDAARAAGVEDDPAARVDVPLTVTTEEAQVCAALPAVLSRAEALASEGRFLTRPALPELVSLRDWVFPDIAAQAAGAEPTTWSPGATLVEPPLRPATPVDLHWVRETDRGVVVADDDNRIVAVSTLAADLLGYGPDDLVGQRLTCIVPPPYREAHVTGFARHVLTGAVHVLGTEMYVPARRRDGRDVMVHLRIEQVGAGDGGLYLGWLR
jgi:PAS domain S-box-containing protein